MIIGGILAGGLGTRMANGGLPKQFIKVAGKPVIIHTLERFLNNEHIGFIVITMNENWMDYCKDLLREYGLDSDSVRIVKGGNTRFESLLCLAQECLNVAAENNYDGEITMINHDCARPFVSDRILNDNLAMVDDYDMVTTSIPTIDTVLISSDGKLSDCVPERSTIFLDQGPQTIKIKHFMKLVDTLSDEEKEKYMEAGRLYIDKGYRVGIVEGERENFKLTTKFDLALAEMMFKED